MTYAGGADDVTVLAHELGHAFHAWDRYQGGSVTLPQAWLDSRAGLKTALIEPALAAGEIEQSEAEALFAEYDGRIESLGGIGVAALSRQLRTAR